MSLLNDLNVFVNPFLEEIGSSELKNDLIFLLDTIKDDVSFLSLSVLKMKLVMSPN
jgi:hypothetical protein